ncbi:MarR family winged helix-turn-helix transcriptional regulator [Spongiactinospora gelatinilytica]|uniref:MarR family winged helix-turn-helix transcriptional regulator n=1 Tax=Spongiactinospora gelatinilytica TaxID=2666298 RepID=UPI001314FC4D|nr:MarR family transcriptional regulator [Spongiactinospora gelatinilytica]
MDSPSPLPVETGQEPRVVQEITHLILRLTERLQDDYARHAARLGLTAGQAKVLMALRPEESVPMRVLAERTGYDPSNLTGLVDRLVARELVSRRPDAVDRRVTVLTTTQQGERLRLAFWRQIHGDTGPLANLSGEELAGLRSSLRTALQPTD